MINESIYLFPYLKTTNLSDKYIDLSYIDVFIE